MCSAEHVPLFQHENGLSKNVYPQDTLLNSNYAETQLDLANENQGSSEEGRSEEGRSEEGRSEEGRSEEGRFEEGNFEDGRQGSSKSENSDPPVRTWNIRTPLIGTITDWPWKVAAYITGDSNNNRPMNHYSCCQWFYVIIRMAVAIMGLLVQTITCFRRDRLDQNIIQENNASKVVKCNDTSQLFSAFIVPDVIVLSILIVVLVRKWRFTHEDITNLINKLTDDQFTKKQPERYMTLCFPIFFIVYMLFSQVVSIMNMLAFHITDNDVIMHSKWTNNISGSWKIVLIILSFLGFIAFDLIYAQFVMRYAYQCEMITYVLGEIKNKIDKYMYANQNDALKDVKKAEDFLKQLNDNTIAIGYITVLTTFRAIISIISLLNKGHTVFQEIAIVARFLQWFFLTMCTPHETARVNAASKALEKTGLSMYRPPVLFPDNDEDQTTLVKTHVSSISLKAKLIGFAVHPWLPFMIVILTVFSLELGSGFKWYEHIL